MVLAFLPFHCHCQGKDLAESAGELSHRLVEGNVLEHLDHGEEYVEGHKCIRLRRGSVRTQNMYI